MDRFIKKLNEHIFIKNKFKIYNINIQKKKKNTIKIKVICFSLFIFFLSNIYIFFYPNQIYSAYYLNKLANTSEIISLNYDKIENDLQNDISKLNINSKNYIVYDRLSNSTLLGKDINRKVKMASTTKIMTALVILNSCDLNKIITVSKKAANTNGSRLGLNNGDVISVSDLLYGLMLCSGNDAAVALAEHCAGSTNNFSVMMNDMAKNLNLDNTNFESPHGLDSDNHYTTAYELALLTNYALKNETFSKIVGTKTYTVSINGYSKSISNTNELLGNLNGIYGVKTGFTNGANRCLVSGCRRNDMDIITIVLGADTKNNRSKDSIKLIEYSFENFTHINIYDMCTAGLNLWKQSNSNSNNYFTIEKGKISNIIPILDSIPNNLLSVLKSDINNIYCNININDYLVAPIAKNQIIGKAYIYLCDIPIYSVDILSDSNIDKKNSLFYIFDFFRNYTLYLSTIL